jgi:hypothetical protein
MNTGQVLFILGAFTMLSLLALNVNRTMTGSLALGLETETTVNALSIGQSMLDEVMQKSFDSKTISKVAYSTDDLTETRYLGPESGEEIVGIDSAYSEEGVFHDFHSKSRFNDVDDYNLYHRQIRDARLGYFDVTDSVRYISETWPDNTSSGRTFYKVIIVVVRHPNLWRAQDTSSTSMPIVLKDFSVYRQYF